MLDFESLVYVTDEDYKLEEAVRVLGERVSNYRTKNEGELSVGPINRYCFPLAKIATLDIRRVLADKLKKGGAHLLGSNVLMADCVSLLVDEWKGRPGPLVEHFTGIGETNEIFFRLVSGLVPEGKPVTASLVTSVWVDIPNINITLFCEGIVKGSIVLPRGKNYEIAYDQIFEPTSGSQPREGEVLTLAEMTDEEWLRISPHTKAFRRVKKCLGW